MGGGLLSAMFHADGNLLVHDSSEGRVILSAFAHRLVLLQPWVFHRNCHWLVWS